MKFYSDSHIYVSKVAGVFTIRILQGWKISRQVWYKEKLQAYFVVYSLLNPSYTMAGKEDPSHGQQTKNKPP